MNKILNWTFGACFRTLGRFLAIFIVFALLLFVGSKLDLELPSWLALKVNASTITSYDSTFSTSNRYYYSTSNTLQSNTLGVIGNVYSGKSYNFTFYLNTSSLEAQSTYDITINANSNDFTKNLNSSSIYIKTSNSTDFTNLTNGISLISFTNSATSSKNSNKIILRIYVNSLSNYTMIDIFNSNYLNITSVSNFGIKSLSIEKVDTSGNNEIIENDKNNTQNIINNSNQNTDEIKNTIKDELNSCRESVNILDVTTNNKDVTCQYCGLVFGTYTIEQGQTYTLSFNTNSNGGKVYIHENSGFSWGEIATTGGRVSMTLTALQSGTFTTALVIASGANVTIPYNLTQIQLEKGNFATSYEEFGKEICQNKLDDLNNGIGNVNNSINDLNNNINDSDITGAESSASGFFDNFSTETFGLTSIITAPLNAINSIINSSCNNLVLPLPFVEKNLTLPCMNSIYSNYFKGFFDLYQIITTGLISYYVIVRIFNLVKDFKNPEHDEIEVMDL